MAIQLIVTARLAFAPDAAVIVKPCAPRLLSIAYVWEAYPERWTENDTAGHPKKSSWKSITKSCSDVESVIVDTPCCRTTTFPIFTTPLLAVILPYCPPAAGLPGQLRTPVDRRHKKPAVSAGIWAAVMSCRSGDKPPERGPHSLLCHCAIDPGGLNFGVS